MHLFIWLIQLGIDDFMPVSMHVTHNTKCHVYSVCPRALFLTTKRMSHDNFNSNVIFQCYVMEILETVEEEI